MNSLLIQFLFLDPSYSLLVYRLHDLRTLQFYHYNFPLKSKHPFTTSLQAETTNTLRSTTEGLMTGIEDLANELLANILERVGRHDFRTLIRVKRVNHVFKNSVEDIIHRAQT